MPSSQDEAKASYDTDDYKLLFNQHTLFRDIKKTVEFAAGIEKENHKWMCFSSFDSAM